MKLRLKHAVAAIVLVLSFAAPVAAGPFQDAVAAHNRGDYSTALRLLRPFAEQGDASVKMGQYRLDTPFLNVQLHIDRDVNARRSGFQSNL
jgi:hypothetical protein